jgi:hypothetical protein
VCTNETKRQLGKQFLWWFPSQRGLYALMNPSVHCGGSLVTISESSTTQFLLTISESTGDVCIDDFWVGSNSIFSDDFRVTWDCVLWWIHASAVEAISLMFLSWQLLSYLWWFLSQQELYALRNPTFSCGASNIDEFWVEKDSVFVDDFRVN